MNRDLIRSRLSAAVAIAAVLLAVELARAGMTVVNIVGWILISARFPDAQSYWTTPQGMMSLIMVALGLGLTVFLLASLIQSRRDLDRL